MVRQGQDTKGLGKPDVLTVFGPDGKPSEQELISDPKRKRPDKKLLLDASGQVTAQCLDTDGNGTLDARAIVANGAVTEVLLDTKGKGKVDQREVYKGGQRVRLEADTNGDHKADVIQTFDGQNQLARQDEDTNFDGTIDRSFAGGKAAPPPANPKISSEPFAGSTAAASATSGRQLASLVTAGEARQRGLRRRRRAARFACQYRG